MRLAKVDLSFATVDAWICQVFNPGNKPTNQGNRLRFKGHMISPAWIYNIFIGFVRPGFPALSCSISTELLGFAVNSVLKIERDRRVLAQLVSETKTWSYTWWVHITHRHWPMLDCLMLDFQYKCWGENWPCSSHTCNESETPQDRSKIARMLMGLVLGRLKV